MGILVHGGGFGKPVQCGHHRDRGLHRAVSPVGTDVVGAERLEGDEHDVDRSFRSDRPGTGDAESSDRQYQR